MDNNFVSLDADHLGHMYTVIAEYHEWVNKRVERAELSTMDFGFEKYQIGYMQARVELGLLTADDVEKIQDWEAAMQ